MSIESESNQSQETFNISKNLIKEKNYQNIKTKRNEPILYYYIASLNFHLCFTETRGSSKDYYYKCSTSRCTAFCMISKLADNALFFNKMLYNTIL